MAVLYRVSVFWVQENRKLRFWGMVFGLSLRPAMQALIQFYMLLRQVLCILLCSTSNDSSYQLHSCIASANMECCEFANFQCYKDQRYR